MQLRFLHDLKKKKKKKTDSPPFVPQKEPETVGEPYVCHYMYAFSDKNQRIYQSRCIFTICMHSLSRAKDCTRTTICHYMYAFCGRIFFYSVKPLHFLARTKEYTRATTCFSENHILYHSGYLLWLESHKNLPDLLTSLERTRERVEAPAFFRESQKMYLRYLFFALQGTKEGTEATTFSVEN